MKETLSPFESRVLTKLLEGDLPELAALRRQLAAASVRRREWTGVGFWTDLQVEPIAPRLGITGRIQITGAYGRYPTLEAGIGFALWLDDGLMSSLEGYTYEEPWPDDVESVVIEHEPSGERRLADLARLFRAHVV